MSDISGSWITDFEPPELDPAKIHAFREYIELSQSIRRFGCTRHSWVVALSPGC